MRQFVFYLVPEFTMLAFTSAIEALRLANGILGYEAYRWRVISAGGENVRASCGLLVATEGSVAQERLLLAHADRPSMAIVCTGKNVEKYHDRAADAWLRECRHRGVAVASLCTGAHLLAQAGLLKDRRCTIHWENFPGFTERFTDVSVNSGLFEIDNGILTCAGGTASFDMMLHLIDQDYGETVVSGICEQALIERARGPADRQRIPLRLRLGVNNPTVVKAVSLMEAHLTEPLRLEELADAVGLSRRQVERLFHLQLQRSPARYYLELRLERARMLLIQSAMPVIEVAVACGFVSSSHFSKCYRETYGCSPQATRAAKGNAPTKLPTPRSRARTAKELSASDDITLEAA